MCHPNTNNMYMFTHLLSSHNILYIYPSLGYYILYFLPNYLTLLLISSSFFMSIPILHIITSQYIPYYLSSANYIYHHYHPSSSASLHLSHSSSSHSQTSSPVHTHSLQIIYPTSSTKQYYNTNMINLILIILNITLIYSQIIRTLKP